MGFWNGRRVLVTGGGGFIPSHLTRRLVQLGADVGVITKYNSIVENVRLVDLWDQVRVIEADIRNADSLSRIGAFAPQVVYHMAAYNHVGDSFLHVSEAMNCNGLGTARVMEAYDGFERFVYISTSEVYGYQTECPFHEDMTPNPVSPYSVGKYSGELYCRMKMHYHPGRIAVVRPFNAFGPYQSVRAVIAEVILDCLAGRPVRSTEGKQTREFNFVSNLVDGMILAGERQEAVDAVTNIGCGREIPIRELITTIHRMTNSKSILEIGALPYRPTEIWRMAADNTRARERLGWSPAVSFEEGLEKTIDWFDRFRKAYYGADSALMALTL